MMAIMFAITVTKSKSNSSCSVKYVYSDFESLCILLFSDVLVTCHGCKKKIEADDETKMISEILIDGKSFHKECFKCQV